MSYRQLPTTSRRIGFEIETPEQVEVIDHPGAGLVKCSERRDGKTVGELEVAVFHAALVIDRDGILEEKAASAIESAREPGARVSPAMPIALPGASGYRAELEVVRPAGVAKAPLPYVYVFAMAPHDLALDGGLIVTVRCASPEWPAADEILRSLRILSRGGKPAANDADVRSGLPLIGSRDE
ncbi:MAG TPA: hypothetical protein VFV99_30505 [Kofleriaceae bacterium]|nr:hypothetical protein [Kofleriaceae bacterium]